MEVVREVVCGLVREVVRGMGRTARRAVVCGLVRGVVREVENRKIVLLRKIVKSIIALEAVPKFQIKFGM